MAENEDIMIEQTGEEQETETVTTEEAAPETTPETAVKTEKKPEKTPAKNRKNPFRSKKFKRGSLSVVFTVLFIAGIVLVNIVLNLVLERFNVEADLTSGSIFTLSDETVNYVSGLDDSISFFVSAVVIFLFLTVRVLERRRWA